MGVAGKGITAIIGVVLIVSIIAVAVPPTQKAVTGTTTELITQQEGDTDVYDWGEFTTENIDSQNDTATFRIVDGESYTATLNETETTNFTLENSEFSVTYTDEVNSNTAEWEITYENVAITGIGASLYKNIPLFLVAIGIVALIGLGVVIIREVE